MGLTADIAVVSGKYLVTIDVQVSGHDGDAQFQSALEIARLVLGRLP